MTDPLPAPPRANPVPGVIAISLAALLVGWAAVFLFAGAAPRQYDDAKDLAVRHADGEVVHVDMSTGSKLADVQWADDQGVRHTTRFHLEGDAPQESDAFAVRYDPADPAGAVFPADDGVLAEAHVGARRASVMAGVVVGLGVAFWVRRWVRVRRALRNEPVPMGAVAMLGSRGRFARSVVCLLPADVDGADLPAGEAGDGAEEDGCTFWQLVIWHPALDRLEPGAPVQVFGDLDGHRGVVVLLDDGTRLWPVGRLRSAPSRLWRIRERPERGRIEARRVRELALAGDVRSREAYEAMLREDFDLPDDEPVDLADPEFEIVPNPKRRHAARRAAATGAVAGAALGLLASGLAGAVAVATVSGALAVFSWSAAGGDPEA